MRRRGRRSRGGFGGLGGGMGGKIGAGAKLAIAEFAVAYGTRAIPQLQSPMIQGAAGLVVPNFAGLPLSAVMIKNAALALVGGGATQAPAW